MPWPDPPPPQEEKEGSDGLDNSGEEQIWLDPYYIFDRYFREKEVKDTGKGKGRHGRSSP